MAEAQYNVTNLGSQQRVLKIRLVVLIKERIKERENIIEKYEDIQAQLDALRTKEVFRIGNPWSEKLNVITKKLQPEQNQ
ncbi:hypothetical protein pb186bvf_015709 [Paramecium bursaria]